MTEYVYRQEINLTEIADEYAKRIQERVDEIALDKAAGTLAKYGYVKIIRCRDCKHFTYADASHGNDDWCAKHEHIGWSVNGFCAWGERRDA